MASHWRKTSEKCPVSSRHYIYICSYLSHISSKFSIRELMQYYRKKNKICWRSRQLIICIYLCWLLCFFLFYIKKENMNISLISTTSIRSELSNIVGDNCRKLPFIRPSGNFFFDPHIKNVTSLQGISPSFSLGSRFGEKVKFHMAADVNHFTLIKEVLSQKKNGIAFDIGANQGFYTFYLATLGFEVHSFEIFESNYHSLQHGIFFNKKEVAENVNVYPIGLGATTGRMQMKGSEYSGFLEYTNNIGNIQSLTFDCFAYHRGDLNIDNIAFIKIDVEGFEIAVLKGMSNSIFRSNNISIGVMLIEVGPSRWKRANTDLAEGYTEMEKLFHFFVITKVILRRQGAGHYKSCPDEVLSVFLSDKNPRIIETDVIYNLKENEIVNLMNEMEKEGFDCNFWFQNK